MNQIVLIQKLEEIEDRLNALPEIQSGELLLKNNEILTSDALERKPWTKRIEFNKPFKKVPKVITGLNKLDLYTKDYSRVGVECKNVDSRSFELCVYTWFDSKILEINIFWIAISESE